MTRTTACRRGHIWTPESTYWRRNGSRFCKICAAAMKKIWDRNHPGRRHATRKPERLSRAEIAVTIYVPIGVARVLSDVAQEEQMSLGELLRTYAIEAADVALEVQHDAQNAMEVSAA